MVRKVRSSPLLPAFFDCLKSRDLFAIYLEYGSKAFFDLTEAHQAIETWLPYRFSVDAYYKQQ